MKKLILISLVYWFNESGYAQNRLTTWKVSNYSNGSLLDTCIIVSGIGNDTSVYYIPGVILMAKFGNKLLMVDYQEENITLLPLMMQNLNISGEKIAIDSLLNKMEKTTINEVPLNDSIYVLKNGNITTTFKYSLKGEILWIEVRELFNNRVNDSEEIEFEVTRTRYERIINSRIESKTLLSTYIQISNGVYKPKGIYANWEFDNLIE